MNILFRGDHSLRLEEEGLYSIYHQYGSISEGKETRDESIEGRLDSRLSKENSRRGKCGTQGSGFAEKIQLYGEKGSKDT